MGFGSSAERVRETEVNPEHMKAAKSWRRCIHDVGAPEFTYHKDCTCSPSFRLQGDFGDSCLGNGLPRSRKGGKKHTPENDG